MMRLGVMLGVLALFGAGGAALQKPAGGDDAAVAKVRAAYQAAVASQDAAAVAKLYAPAGEEMPPNAPTAKGRAAIEKYHRDFAQQFMMHGITITPTATHIAGTWAIEVGTYKQMLMGQKTGAMIDDKGKYVVVLSKNGGSWQIEHSIYNSDNPPPSAAAPKK